MVEMNRRARRAFESKMACRRPRRMTGGDDVSVSLSSDVQLYMPSELLRRYIYTTALLTRLLLLLLYDK